MGGKMEPENNEEVYLDLTQDKVNEENTKDEFGFGVSSFDMPTLDFPEMNFESPI